MPYCTSCGSPIPDGQGKSCSMCYGDIGYGRDYYYRGWADDRIIEKHLKNQRDEEEYNRLIENNINNEI
jgi:hypothetical protein